MAEQGVRFGIRDVLSALVRRFWLWLHDLSHKKLGPEFVDEDQVVQGVAEWLDMVRQQYGQELMVWLLHNSEIMDDLQGRTFRDYYRNVRDPR